MCACDMQIDFGEWDVARTREAVQACVRELVAPLLDRILENFDNRLAPNPTTELLSTMLDFRRMPLDRSYASDYDPLLLWGHEAAVEFITDKYPAMDQSEFLIQYDRAKLWVRENRDQFTKRIDAVMNEDGSTRTPAKSILQLIGDGGIFPAMHSRTDAVSSLDMRLFMKVVEFMISYRLDDVDVEQIGTKLVKTHDKSRSSLGSDTIRSLVHLSYNLPYLHELDVVPLVDQWIDDGHNLPTIGEGAVAQVLKRLRARRSPGFVLKKALD